MSTKSLIMPALSSFFQQRLGLHGPHFTVAGPPFTVSGRAGPAFTVNRFSMRTADAVEICCLPQAQGVDLPSSSMGQGDIGSRRPVQYSLAMVKESLFFNHGLANPVKKPNTICTGISVINESLYVTTCRNDSHSQSS
jgi:hypothetical protein